MRGAAPVLISRCNIMQGSFELQIETLKSQHSLCLSRSCPDYHEDREHILHCKPTLSGKESGKRQLRLPLVALRAS